MIFRPSRADCARLMAESRIFNVHTGEVGTVIIAGPGSVEIQWPSFECPVGLSFDSIMNAGHYCLF